MLVSITVMYMYDMVVSACICGMSVQVNLSIKTVLLLVAAGPADSVD